jgi:hypothetical protein
MLRQVSERLNKPLNEDAENNESGHIKNAEKYTDLSRGVKLLPNLLNKFVVGEFVFL